MKSHSQSSHSGIIESFSSDCYERCMSTGIEPFSLLICLGTTEFVLLSVFTLKETICPKICSKSRLKSAKSLLPVDVRRSKTSLLQGSPENGGRKWNLFSSHEGNFQHHFVYSLRGAIIISPCRAGTRDANDCVAKLPLFWKRSDVLLARLSQTFHI